MPDNTSEVETSPSMRVLRFNVSRKNQRDKVCFNWLIASFIVQAKGGRLHTHNLAHMESKPEMRIGDIP